MKDRNFITIGVLFIVFICIFLAFSYAKHEKEAERQKEAAEEFSRQMEQNMIDSERKLYNDAFAH